MNKGKRCQRILVTGFGSFREFNVNPSWQAVQTLQSIWNSDEELIVKEVPVEYEYVKEEIPILWRDLNPDLVVHVGVSPLEPETIHLEKCAHSNGYVKLDINHCCGPLATGNTECISTSLDVDYIVNECAEVFPHVKSSTDAGRYLCEYIYYTSLHIKPSCVLFIHVPVLEENKVTVLILAHALKRIIECCTKQIDTRP